MLKRTTIAIAALAMTACGTAGSAAETGAPDPTLAAQPWAAFYQKASEEFQAGRRDEAVTLFYIGQLRGRIVVQCQPQQPSGEPALLSSLNATLGQTINEYAGGDPEGWAAAIDRALDYDAAHPDPNAATPECRAERERQRSGLTGLRDQIRADPERIRSERAARGLPNR